MSGGFCEDAFWDWDLTWTSSGNRSSEDGYYGPDFTTCFEQTALAWTPCFYLFLATPFEIYVSKKQNRISAITADNFRLNKLKDKNGAKTQLTLLNVLKCALISILLLLQCLLLIKEVFYNNEKHFYVVARLTPTLRIMALCLAMFLVLFARRNKIRPSGVQFVFWTLMVTCGVFGFRTAVLKYLQKSDVEDGYQWLIPIVTFPILVCQLFLNCIADSGRSPCCKKSHTDLPYEATNPEERASFISRLLFLWLEPLLWKAYKKPLEFEDLWELKNKDKCNYYVNVFYYHWNKSCAEKNPSIAISLARVFGPSILLGAFLKLLQDCLLLMTPQILRLLVLFIENREDTWKGILYAVLLLCTSFLQTLFLGQYFCRMFQVGTQCRSTLMTVIYRKALSMSNATRRESTIGEIVNLMSVDAAHFVDLLPYLNMLWSSPFQITVCLYFLWDIIGWSAFAGLGVLILALPLNSILTSKLKKLQIKQMRIKDQRVKLMSELISGMKVLKLYAWEQSFKKEVMRIRQKEMDILKSTAWIEAAVSFVAHCTPFMVALASSGTYVMVDKSHVFDATKAFVSLTIFNIMRGSLTLFPFVISNVVKAQVSLQRLSKFLTSPEVDGRGITYPDMTEKYAITIENATFNWDEDEVALKNINLNIKQGALVAIVGPVGSGKSSILAAMLGELPHSAGTNPININGSIAYVAQQAWIQSGTLQENVLFGKPNDPAKYEVVLESCALLPDLANLAAGDQTQIGEKGINLSGGQKQRVSLARAAYSNADIYLMDDPFSALDSRVGKYIFEKVVGPNGVLKDKTRILVTHDFGNLPHVDQIIVMKNGQCTEVGSYEELVASKGEFSKLLLLHSNIQTREPNSSLSDNHANDNSKKNWKEQSTKLLESMTNDEGPDPSHILIKTETSETGSVKKGVYIHYFKSIGLTLVIVTMVLQLLSQVFSIGTNLWLAEWSSAPVINGTQDSSKRIMYLGVYASLGFGQSICLIISSILMALGMSNASAALHCKMLNRVLKAPMRFFESTPTGRLVNRFSKDVDTLDSILPGNFRDFLLCFTAVGSTFLVIAYSIPAFIVVILPIVFINYCVQRFYVAASRQLKRMESVSRSPIYSHFGETLSGLSTIRAFGLQKKFTLDFEEKVDVNQAVTFPMMVSNRWLSIRLETVANTIVFFVSLFAVLGTDDLSPGLLGLCISYALQITSTLNWVVRMTANLETNIVAVERIKEYSEVEQEYPHEVEENKPADTWPEKGSITFDAYHTSYRPGLDAILHNITCTIEPGEKVGIVGRTGAGKSSLALGLFRMIEPTSGSILIDHQNIAKIGLFDLRSRLSIIPQDPVLFSGSLRLNLDPFGDHSDESLWRALELANLKTFVKSLDGGLSHEVLDGGENLSVGQRQLICLVRVILRKTKILILDEATASVDLETDNLIQKIIRKEFASATVLTIAHRLNTIMDSGRVLVLDQGRLQEFDSPVVLLSNKSSVFYAMANAAGLVR